MTRSSSKLLIHPTETQNSEYKLYDLKAVILTVVIKKVPRTMCNSMTFLNALT